MRMNSLFARARSPHLPIELLSSYLDNAVSSAERVRVQQHLATCSTCQTDLATLQHTVALLRELPPVPLPRVFTLSEQRLRARQTAPALWSPGLLRALGAVAALVVVGFVGISLLNRPGQFAAAPVARVTPTSVPQPLAAPVAPTIPTATSPVRGVQSPASAAQLSAPAPASAPAAAPTAAAPAKPAAAQPRSIAAPTATEPSPTPAEPTRAPAIAMAKVVTPTEATSDRAAIVPPSAPAAAAAPVFGLGGGPAGPEPSPQPLPPTATISTAMPKDGGVAWTDAQGMSVMDQSGIRRLVTGQNLQAPMISPDRLWIAYRSQSEVWAARWDGSQKRQIVSEAALPAGKLAASERHLGAVRWAPGQHKLILTVVAGSTQPGAPERLEIFTQDAEGEPTRYLFESTPNSLYVFSPDGNSVAVLRRGDAPDGKTTLSLLRGDGSGSTQVLESAANVNGIGSDSQLSWSSDSKTLLAAIPTADAGTAVGKGGMILYRVSGGKAVRLGQIDAQEVYWSPDGTRLAFLRGQGATGETRGLYLANADGTGEEKYGADPVGMLQNWSPDGKHLIYTAGEQWYVGAQGQAPLLLGSGAGISNPQWASSQVLLYLAPQGNNQVLIARPLDGKPGSLGAIPLDGMVDIYHH
jgi:Tol biopolymer transport system component